MSNPIESYALIGDGASAALVGRDGSIDWLCWPRFDDDACFCALLGGPEHGRWRIAPVDDGYEVSRCYRGDTLVLETTTQTDAGIVRVNDFMPVRALAPEGAAALVRIVEGLSGAVPMEFDLRLRFDYGALPPRCEVVDGGLNALAGPARVTLRGDVPVVPNRRLLAWYPDGRVEVAIDGTQFMNGNALCPDGSLVHCEHGRRCISRSVGDGAPEPIVTHFEGRQLNSPNDVTVAADGAVWFTDPTFGILMPNQGSLAEPELDHRSVYRFDPATGKLRRMADFDEPNGLFFAPDGRTLYVSDTARSLGEIVGGHERDTHEIQAFDVGADGALTNRRLFCRTDHGYPDGFAVDGRGWVWAAAGDGVHVYAPDGARLGFVPTPEVASNCAFRADGRRLFVAATLLLLTLDLIA